MFAVVVTQSHWNPFGFSVRILFVSCFLIVLCYWVPCVLVLCFNFWRSGLGTKVPKVICVFLEHPIRLIERFMFTVALKQQSWKRNLRWLFPKNNTVLLFFATSKRHSDRTFGDSHGLGCFTSNLEGVIHHFMAENNDLKCSGSDPYLSLFTFSCKPSQCMLKGTDWEQNHVICKR